MTKRTKSRPDAVERMESDVGTMLSPQRASPLSPGGGVWVETMVLYYLTSAIVVLGVYLGYFYLIDSRNQDHFFTPHRTSMEAAFANWDGQWYLRIARDGYTYSPDAKSSVAFFPAFPLSGRCLVWITGLDYDIALTLVSNVSFFLSLMLLGEYVRLKPEAPSGLVLYAPLAMALFPVGFFFRMAYSESLFVLLAVLILYGLARRWHILTVAAMIGLATAARPVGVALVPCLFLSGWRRYPFFGRRLFILAVAAPLCFWGLAAYIGFQYVRFGEPLAFAKTQVHWRFRDESKLSDQLLAVATLEPFWSVYDESSQAYWRRHDRELGPVLSLQFANPIYFAGITILIGYGAWRRWLSREELLYSVGVLLIPYLSRSYEGCMNAHARFASVTFPVYLVLGRLLVRLPQPYTAAVLGLSGFLLGTYSALFAGWFLLF